MATCHMTLKKEWLTHYQPFCPVLADDSVVWSERIPSASLSHCERGVRHLLYDSPMFLYVPQLASNLLPIFTLIALCYTLAEATRGSKALARDAWAMKVA